MLLKKVLLKILLLIFISSSFVYSKESVLKIYSWTDYIDISILKNFVAKTGIKIEYDMYTSNEEMYENIKKKNYDLVFPSTDYVSKLKKEGLIQKISKTKLQNLKNIDPELLNDQLYSIPYFWGTTGIVYDEKSLGFKITTWSDLWDERLKNKLAISEDMKDMFAIALKKLGYSANSQNEDEIRQAYLELLKLIPNVKTIGSNVKVIGSADLENDFINKHILASISYNGDIVEFIDSNKDLKYIYPEEGVLKWMDNIVILKNSQNEKLVYDFLNFILSPEVAKVNAQTIGFATPNLKAKMLLTADILNNQVIYPSSADLENSEFQKNIDDSYLIYRKYWGFFLSQINKDAK
ncbi:MAG: spermidine/putrescine ABC transporter substrate-binding protein [Campylobacteraceae bacterium]|nr:spermidine/putrescine ABC transporter substrate-binding protein [Campylobacteraceae bacterium]